MSIGRLYAYFHGPYITSFETFEVEMSTDRERWVDIPIYSEEIDFENCECMVDVGFVELDKPLVKLYIRTLVPPQTIDLPEGVTEEDLRNSTRGFINIKREVSSRDKFTIFLTIISLTVGFYEIIVILLQIFTPFSLDLRGIEEK